uniref:Uncharacterized protein n=1 Tax=Eutreptiella gymnastica TaxID=73025 RepID=A0A7S1HUS5_9EUGL|mmetsp:Transcript_107302/g.185139  ORF Transcript_107302/g.185139 Transcript_107302/m.185139 type:complete len:104 (+) Transcript_107302:82-393(+)
MGLCSAAARPAQGEKLSITIPKNEENFVVHKMHATYVPANQLSSHFPPPTPGSQYASSRSCTCSFRSCLHGLELQNPTQHTYPTTHLYQRPHRNKEHGMPQLR